MGVVCYFVADILSNFNCRGHCALH